MPESLTPVPEKIIKEDYSKPTKDEGYWKSLEEIVEEESAGEEKLMTLAGLEVMKEEVREATATREKLASALREQEIETLLAQYTDKDYDILSDVSVVLEAIKPLVREAVLDSKSVWILEADLDVFKEVNDKFGDSVGDKVIAAYAKAQNEAIRDSDVSLKVDLRKKGGKLSRGNLSSRLGGDEFRVFLFDTPSNEILGISQRIYNRWQELLAEIEIEVDAIEKDDLTSRLTLSMGATSVRKKQHGRDIEKLFGIGSAAERAGRLRDKAKGKGLGSSFASNFKAVAYGFGIKKSPKNINIKNTLLIEGREEEPLTIDPNKVALISSRSPLSFINKRIIEKNKERNKLAEGI